MKNGRSATKASLELAQALKEMTHHSFLQELERLSAFSPVRPLHDGRLTTLLMEDLWL